MTAAATHPSLSVSIVTYSPDFGVLTKCLASLAEALRQAAADGILGRAKVVIVDNGPGTGFAPLLREDAERNLSPPGPGTVKVMSGHGNVGYGRGHNLAILECDESYHLVLNPDVILDPQSISEALHFMQMHEDVGFVSPAAVGAEGEKQYLCKRYPPLFDLVLRGFSPVFLRRILRARLERYEMRGETGSTPVLDIPIASGSFMFLRRDVLKKLGGFSDAFFMYFEDFDLSVRLNRVSRIAYVPAVKIIHLGGDAAGKGWGHVCMFVRSGITFYSRHGWKWF